MPSKPDEALYYNAVALSLHGDPAKMRRAAKFGDWKTAYENLPGMDALSPELAWERLRTLGIRLILRSDAEYPPLLGEIEQSPLALYVRGGSLIGAPPKKTGAWISIVGTRRATQEGDRLARQFAKELAEAGCGIVSGLALGIDAAAHVGALEAGGACIAVLANGLDTIYPRANGRLAEKIFAAGGAIVSEYPIGEPPLKHRFLERNRIVSGLSKGTLVLEAPESSGSLATAGFALEQNRDVFVVPGNITHPNFRGANELIRQGAMLVTSPRDILEAYGMEPVPVADVRTTNASPEEKLILSALRAVSQPLDVDKIIEMTKLEPHIVNRTLTFMIFKNLAREIGGQYTI